MRELETQKKAVKAKSRKVKVNEFPAIPDKLYFSIGEVSKLCVVRPYVIRFWEQVFSQLKPAKLRCGRRYYCKEEIVLIRKIRTLLYEKGFTIDGARAQLVNKTIGKDEVKQVDKFYQPENKQLQITENGQCLARNELLIEEAYEINGFNVLNMRMDGNDLSKSELLSTAREDYNRSTILQDVASHIENILSLIDSIFEVQATS